MSITRIHSGTNFRSAGCSRKWHSFSRLFLSACVSGDKFLHYTAPPGSFVMCFLGALWVCRRIESHFILHGTLVGVVAALIYVALTVPAEPFGNCVPSLETVDGGRHVRSSTLTIEPVNEFPANEFPPRFQRKSTFLLAWLAGR